MRFKTPAILVATGYILILCVLCVHPSGAAVVRVKSCTSTDVQNAVNAAADGDTVLVPEGTCTWSTPNCYSTTNTCSAVRIYNKSVDLQGAGVDKTVITSGIPYAWNTTLIHIDGSVKKAVRISGLTFKDQSTSATSRFIIMSGASGGWRLDHNDFVVSPNKFGGERYVVFPYTFGLVDHCRFVNALINFKHLQDGVISWGLPPSLGTADAAYVEDSSFYYGDEHGQVEDFTDGEGGARVVIRHNSIANAMFHFHGIEGGSLRGIYTYELYHNKFTGEGSVNNYRKGYMRGGTGAIYNNSWSGTFSSTSPFYLVHQCLYIQNNPADARCNGDKWCFGYPCPDQIGRAADTDFDGRQNLYPLFSWNNRGVRNGQDYVVRLSVQSDICPACPDYIKEGRDYFNEYDANGAPVAFDAVTGYYSAWYQDDFGLPVLWKYKPYIYPHPLASADFGTSICPEGAIASACWCEGMQSTGYCCHGYFQDSCCAGDTKPPGPPQSLSIR